MTFPLFTTSCKTTQNILKGGGGIIIDVLLIISCWRLSSDNNVNCDMDFTLKICIKIYYNTPANCEKVFNVGWC